MPILRLVSRNKRLLLLSAQLLSLLLANHQCRFFINPCKFFTPAFAAALLLESE